MIPMKTGSKLTALSISSILVLSYSSSVVVAAPAYDDSTSASTAVMAPDTFGKEPEPLSDANSTGSSTESSYEANEDVLSYWTPDRIAETTAVDIPEATTSSNYSSQSKATGPEEATEPAKPSQEPVDKAAAALVPEKTEGETRSIPVDNAPATVGKLVLTDSEGKNRHCSASAINTTTKRAIITSGHCAYDRNKGEWARNVVFIPAYDWRNVESGKDSAPFGKWTVSSMRTFNSWIDDGDIQHDVAIMTLNNGGNENKRIVDVVGGYGLMMNYVGDYDATIFGYPSNKENPSGTYSMWSCSGTAYNENFLWFFNTENTIQGCDFGGGASGGPWLSEYDSSSGVGYVRTITTNVARSELVGIEGNIGPFFNGDIKVLKEASEQD